MFNVKVMCKEDTEKLLKMAEVIPAIESVYAQKAEDNTDVFPLVFHEFKPGVADMDIKSGHLKGSGIWGMKVVSWYGENSKQDLPALIGTILVFDDKTGKPLGILDGAHITGMRTGASGAIGAKYLARKEAKRVLIVGAGHVATFQIAAMLTLFDDLQEIAVYGGRSHENAVNFVNNLPNVLNSEFNLSAGNTVLSAVEDIEQATKSSDIIITVTPSKEPIIKKEWVKAGTHFSCIGADMSGKEEIDPYIFANARTFVDDTAQNINVGEIEIPVKMGILKPEDIAGEIGEVIIGKTVGRQNDEQITVFDATGTALLDLRTAQLVFDNAEKQAIGSTVNL